MFGEWNVEDWKVIPNEANMIFSQQLNWIMQKK